MRILVTGASGYVGSHVVAALVGSGHSVRGLVRSPEKARRVLARHGSPEHEVVQGDMTDRAVVAEAIDGCDAVVHTAAVVALDRAGAAAAADTNQRGAEVVLGEAGRADVDVVVHLSSAAVFSFTDGAPITEATPLTRAAGGYAASKVAIERFVRGMQAAGAPLTLLYPVGIYGGAPVEVDQTHEALAYWVNDATLNTSSGINVVDVRDVAEAAVRCVEQTVIDERLVLSAGFVPWAEMGGLLDELVQGAVPRIRIPGRVLRGMGRAVDRVPALGKPVAFPLTHEAMTYATKNVVTDGARATQVLDLEYRPVRSTLHDALRWLAREGHLDRDWPGLVEPAHPPAG